MWRTLAVGIVILFCYLGVFRLADYLSQFSWARRWAERFSGNWKA